MDGNKMKRIPLPDLTNVSATVSAVKSKGRDAEAAVGGFMLRRPKLTWWLCFIAAIAGAKLVSQLAAHGAEVGALNAL